jgi:hypothetical protein
MQIPNTRVLLLYRYFVFVTPYYPLNINKYGHYDIIGCNITHEYFFHS